MRAIQIEQFGDPRSVLRRRHREALCHGGSRMQVLSSVEACECRHDATPPSGGWRLVSRGRGERTTSRGKYRSCQECGSQRVDQASLRAFDEVFAAQARHWLSRPGTPRSMLMMRPFLSNFHTKSWTRPAGDPPKHARSRHRMVRMGLEGPSDTWVVQCRAIGVPGRRRAWAL